MFGCMISFGYYLALVVGGLLLGNAELFVAWAVSSRFTAARCSFALLLRQRMPHCGCSFVCMTRRHCTQVLGVPWPVPACRDGHAGCLDNSERRACGRRYVTIDRLPAIHLCLSQRHTGHSITPEYIPETQAEREATWTQRLRVVLSNKRIQVGSMALL